jgi:hypothetical protein
LALLTFNRGLKLMALALVSLVAGVGNTNAQTPAIVGRPVSRYVSTFSNVPLQMVYTPEINPPIHLVAGIKTNNGLLAKNVASSITTYYCDLNDLAVNRAMAAAPIGSLKVTPSSNASEQTKVQWSVE